MASTSLVRLLGLMLCLTFSSNLLASAQFVCPTDFVLLKDRCYYFSYNTDRLVERSFEEARNYCKSSSGNDNYDLLTINDNEEFALITAEIKDLPYILITWVGAYREADTNDWYWVDGTPLPIDDNLWDCNEIDDPSLYAAYIYLIEYQGTTCYNFGNFRLGTVSTTAEIPFICEGPALSDSSNLTSEELASSNMLSSVPLACPTDFILLKDRCYFFSQFEYSNFTEARNYCNSLSFGPYIYDLLIISDYEEYVLITAELTVKGLEGLVGGYRETNTESWYWVDGSSLAGDDFLWDCDETSRCSSFYNVTYLYYISHDVPNCYNFNTYRLKAISSLDSRPFICEGPALSVSDLFENEMSSEDETEDTNQPDELLSNGI